MLEDREYEIQSRQDFAALIKKLSIQNPSLNFIFRPHPALNPTYWYNSFATQKNIHVICRGSVQPWIYAALATIHSGCTTGLEAYGCNINTIDVSRLIGERSSYSI